MSAWILALANLKGGCGKSTLAVNLAAGLAAGLAKSADPHRRVGLVGLVDADPQGALAHWANWGGSGGAAATALPKVEAGGTDPVAVINRMALSHAHVVVDCPPSLDMAVTRRIMERARGVLIPVLPSPLDLWACAETVAAVRQARQVNPGLAAWLLVNQAEPASALSRAMSQALAGLEVPVLSCMVRRRAAFRTAILEGVSVYQLGARGREAAREIDQVIQEVMGT